MGTKERALDTLIDAVKDAVYAYDRSGDHKHSSGDDCIRCKLVAAIGYHPDRARRHLPRTGEM